MARVILENLTPEQAKIFVSYFEGQGEQDCREWFEISECDSPYAGQTRKEDGDYIITCVS